MNAVEIKKVSIGIKELPGCLYSSLYDMLPCVLYVIQPESDCTKPQSEVVQSSSPQSNAGQSSQAQQATPTATQTQPRVPVQTCLGFSPTGLTLNRELLGVEVSSECVCCLCVEGIAGAW